MKQWVWKCGCRGMGVDIPGGSNTSTSRGTYYLKCRCIECDDRWRIARGKEVRESRQKTLAMGEEALCKQRASGKNR